MKFKTWRVISREVVNQNPWSTFLHDKFETSDGKIGDYFYVKTPVGSVMVVPILKDGRFVLHREYRYLFDRVSLAFPSGGIKIDQTPKEAAKAELKEESGYAAGKLKEIGRLAPSTGLIKEYTTFFIATDLSRTDKNPDEFEEFEEAIMTAEQINAAIDSGEIWDGFTVNAWYLLNALETF